MINNKISLMITLVILLLACNAKNTDSSVADEVQVEAQVAKDIPFQIAQKYFLKTSVKQIADPKIDSKEEFDALFGSATTMGEGGTPTEIDFSKEYVIAISKPENEFATVLHADKIVQHEAGELVVNYKVEVGPKQSYTSVPLLLLVVDKAIQGEIVLNEKK